MNKLSTIAVVGGAGFVGSRLIPKLREAGYEVRIGDLRRNRNEDDVAEVDVRVRDSLSKLGKVETVINLAAVHRDDVRPVSAYTDVNVGGAENVCAYAREISARRIVFTSSVAVYGFAPPNTDESGTVNYFNEYGKTKYLAEKVYLNWQTEDPNNRSLIIVRPTVIFGPGNRGNVYNLLKLIAGRRFAMFGDGKNVKSMAYVENVAAFLVQCAAAKTGVHVYNYVDKPDLSMNQLVHIARNTLFDKSGVGLRLPRFLGVSIGVGFDLLARLIRRPLPISSIRLKKFMATTQFSSAAPDTGFEAPYTLSEGLEKTLRYEFLEDNRDKPTYETE